MHTGLPLQWLAQHRSCTCFSQPPQYPTASQPERAPTFYTTQKTETRCNLEVSKCPRSSGRSTGQISPGVCTPGRAPCICDDRSATASSVMRELKHKPPCVDYSTRAHTHTHTHIHWRCSIDLSGATKLRINGRSHQIAHKRTQKNQLMDEQLPEEHIRPHALGRAHGAQVDRESKVSHVRSLCAVLGSGSKHHVDGLLLCRGRRAGHRRLFLC